MTTAKTLYGVITAKQNEVNSFDREVAARTARNPLFLLTAGQEADRDNLIKEIADCKALYEVEKAKLTQEQIDEIEGKNIMQSEAMPDEV